MEETEWASMAVLQSFAIMIAVVEVDGINGLPEDSWLDRLIKKRCGIGPFLVAEESSCIPIVNVRLLESYAV
jgi:hypothetical protein